MATYNPAKLRLSDEGAELWRNSTPLVARALITDLTSEQRIERCQAGFDMVHVEFDGMSGTWCADTMEELDQMLRAPLEQFVVGEWPVDRTWPKVMSCRECIERIRNAVTARLGFGDDNLYALASRDLPDDDEEVEFYDIPFEMLSYIVAVEAEPSREEYSHIPDAEPLPDHDVDEEGRVIVLSVALYMVDRVCGGPEEGGWWYDEGDPVDLAEARELLPDSWQPTFHTSWREATAARDKLRQAIDAAALNEGRPSISSMASCGQYMACIVTGQPHCFPEQRPYYE
jgi:hypothetical protein